MSQQPHDRLFKETFSRPDVARALLETILPAELQARLDLNSLQLRNGSFVDESLGEHVADLVYDCPLLDGSTARIAFLLEHKSYPDKRPHLQLLRYLLNAWQADVKAGADTLSLLVPVVIYHGRPRWKYQPFTDFFAADAAWHRFLPQFEYLFYDLSALSDEAIGQFRNTFLSLSALLLKHSRRKNYLETIADQLAGLLAELGPGNLYANTVAVYLYQSSELEVPQLFAIFEKASKQTQDLVMSTYDQIIEQGRQQGRQQGQQEGREEGQRRALENTVLTMQRKGFAAEFIANALDLPLDTVQQVLKNAV